MKEVKKSEASQASVYSSQPTGTDESDDLGEPAKQREASTEDFDDLGFELETDFPPETHQAEESIAKGNVPSASSSRLSLNKRSLYDDDDNFLDDEEEPEKRSRKARRTN